MTDDKKENVDQGFNDAELEDIMNEIESLEKDFDMASPAEDVVDPIAEELGDIGSPVMEKEEFDEPEIDEEISSEDPVSEAEELLDDTPMNSIDEELEKAFEEEFEANHDSSIDLESDLAEKTELQGVIDQEVDELLKDRDMDVAAEIETPVVDNVVEMAAPEPAPAPTPAPAPAPTGAPAQTHMSFSMSGNATIALDFEFAGQKVSLHVNEEEGFIIEMDGGAKFSIPVVDSFKKAS